MDTSTSEQDSEVFLQNMKLIHFATKLATADLEYYTQEEAINELKGKVVLTQKSMREIELFLMNIPPNMAKSEEVLNFQRKLKLMEFHLKNLHQIHAKCLWKQCIIVKSMYSVDLELYEDELALINRRIKQSKLKKACGLLGKLFLNDH